MELVIAGGTSHHQAMAQAFFARHAPQVANSSITLNVIENTETPNEKFHLVAKKENAAIHADISISSHAGFRWSLNALLRFIEGAETRIDLQDSPAFARRGVIEGFYGIPWTHEQRLRGIECFADFGMNSFMLAPKDSPWQRFDWRKPFVSQFLGLAKELVERAQLHGLSLSVCVSPGLSVTYSDDNDVAAVMIRYKQLLDLGVTEFGLLFDDIPWELQVPADIAKYDSIAHAQASFTNRVLAELKALDNEAKLIVCPMEYCGRGPIEYIHQLGTHMSPEVELMWTGRQICSEYLDIVDAIVFKESAQRPPLYWDNYPVNDVAMTHELHVGPIRGREIGLENYSLGLLANPMEKFEASLLPLSTIGDYLWNSTKYNPQESWDRALAHMVTNPDDHAAMRRLLRNSLGSCLNGNAAPDMGTILGSTTTAWRNGRPEEAAEIFRKSGEVIMRDHALLTSQKFSRRDLIQEMGPWVDKYLVGGQTMEQLAMVLAQCSWTRENGLTGPDGLAAEVLTIRERFEKIQARLFGDGLDLLMGELSAELRANEK